MEFFTVPGRSIKVRLSEIAYYDYGPIQPPSGSGFTVPPPPKHKWGMVIAFKSGQQVTALFEIEASARNAVALLNSALGLPADTSIPEKPNLSLT